MTYNGWYALKPKQTDLIIVVLVLEEWKLDQNIFFMTMLLLLVIRSIYLVGWLVGLGWVFMAYQHLQVI